MIRRSSTSAAPAGPRRWSQRVDRVSKELGLFRTDDTPDPEFTSTLELDLGTVEPSLAGPKRPQDRIRLSDMRGQFASDLPKLVPAGFSLPPAAVAEGEGQQRTGESWGGEGGSEEVAVAAGKRCALIDCDGEAAEVGDGTVVIASITSCTNTSNPSVMVGAGLLAKKAVEKGLSVQPWVKTSMAPGSQVVTDYLTKSGLLPYLEQLKFHVVGYGCTTCIGNSGPLPENVHAAVEENGLVVASVLSGNRNFEARIHPLVRANYLASPVLVVAYALAGRVDIDLHNRPPRDRVRRRAGLPGRHLAVSRGDPRHGLHGARAGDVHVTLRGRQHGRRELAGTSGARGEQPVRLGR